MPRNEAAALAELGQLHDDGDAAATYFLGRAYQLARGVEVDHRRAVGYFEQAARAGFPPAKAALAECLDFGIGARTDTVRAMVLLREAADAGDENAQHRLLIRSTALQPVHAAKENRDEPPPPVATKALLAEAQARENDLAARLAASERALADERRALAEANHALQNEREEHQAALRSVRERLVLAQEQLDEERQTSVRERQSIERERRAHAHFVKDLCQQAKAQLRRVQDEETRLMLASE